MKEEYADLRWAIRIVEEMEKQGLTDTDEESLSENSQRYAQIIMNNPLSHIFEPQTLESPTNDLKAEE